MATCQALIKRSLRMLGELNSGRDPPANEAAEALEALQGLYKHLVASGTLGGLRDVLASGNITAGENQRIINTSGGVIVITLPTTVTDYDTYGSAGSAVYDYGFCGQGNGTRAVRDRSVVVEASATPVTYIYDADLASWVSIDALTLTSIAPFTQKLETGMAALLAAHIISEYKDGPLPSTVAMGAAQCMSALTQRRDSPATVSQAEYF